MQLERPRFRQDLVAEPIEDGNTTFIDVMDPDSNTVYRFFEVEYSLACAMDGERDVAGVVRWAQEELGLSTNANEVKSVIATLGELRFLDGGEATLARPEATLARPDAALARPEAAHPAAGSNLRGAGATTSAPATKVDDELKSGVVVGEKHAQPPVADMELGRAGGVAPAAAYAAATGGTDVELGTGVSAGVRAPATSLAKADDIALGVPGRADVSVDLSEQVKPSANDVKEAVRASKVMNAVELPDDLKAALDQTQVDEKPITKQKRPPRTPPKGAPIVDVNSTAAVEAAAGAAAKATEAAKVEAAKVEAAKVEAAKVEAAKAVKAPKTADAGKSAKGAKASEATKAKAAAAAKSAAKTQPKPVEAKQPGARPAVVPPAPEQKVSRPLLVGLVVVVLAVVAFLVYKNLIANHSAETENMPAPAKIEPAPPPPAPAPETEKLATKALDSESIKPVSPGTLEMIAASDAKVKEGDPLVRFTGAKALDTEVTALEKDIQQRIKAELAKAQQERDAAIAANDKPAQTRAEAKLAERQKSLDDKQAKISTKKADLDKLQITASTTGTFTAKAKPGAKVTPTDEVGMLVREPTRTVTFKQADPAAGPKARVILVTKDGAKLACVVTLSDANGTTIECPENAAPEGTEVTFGGVDMTPPAAPGSDASVPGGSGGSAAAGSAASGVGSAAAGSAAGAAAPMAVPSHAPARPARPSAPPHSRPAPKAPAGGSAAMAPTGEAPPSPPEKPAPPAGSDQ